MKLCWVISPLVTDLSFGGTKTHLLNWCKFIDKEVYDITIVLSGRDLAALEQFAAFYRTFGVKVKVVNWLLPVCFWMKGGAVQFYRFLKKEKFDLIHSIFVQADIAAGVVAKLAGVKKQVSSLEGRLYKPQLLKGKVYKFLYKLIRRKIDSTIAISRDTREMNVRDCGVVEKRCQVIYSGVDFKRFCFTPARSGEAVTKVGYMARLLPEKKPDTFLKVAKTILSENSQFHFFVGGGGPALKKIEDLALEYKINDKVSFLGSVKPDDFFKEIDIFVFLSKEEGLPWTILEAMASGVPVIASDVGGISEVISNKDNGLLVNETSDCEGLKRSIYYLADDTNRRDSIVDKAKNTIYDFFNADREIEELTQLYDKVLKGKR